MHERGFEFYQELGLEWRGWSECGFTVQFEKQPSFEWYIGIGLIEESHPQECEILVNLEYCGCRHLFEGPLRYQILEWIHSNSVGKGVFLGKHSNWLQWMAYSSIRICIYWNQYRLTNPISTVSATPLPHSQNMREAHWGELRNYFWICTCMDWHHSIGLLWWEKWEWNISLRRDNQTEENSRVHWKKFNPPVLRLMICLRERDMDLG